MEDEISGEAAISRDGELKITMNIHNSVKCIWFIHTDSDGMDVYLDDITEEKRARITDIISAKVEGATLLRENYAITETAIENFKALIDNAWGAPRVLHATLAKEAVDIWGGE